MRYDEMRQHVETYFRNALQKYNDRLLSEGDGSGQRADALRHSISLVEYDIWLQLAAQPDEQGIDLLSHFKAHSCLLQGKIVLHCSFRKADVEG